MTNKEWEELKGKVDDSFWVMRIIGEGINSGINGLYSEIIIGYPPLPNNYDGYSCGAHK